MHLLICKETKPRGRHFTLSLTTSQAWNIDCEAQTSSLQIMMSGRDKGLNPSLGLLLGKCLINGQHEESCTTAWQWLISAHSLISICLGLQEPLCRSIPLFESRLNYWGLFCQGLAAENIRISCFLITFVRAYSFPVLPLSGGRSRCSFALAKNSSIWAISSLYLPS